MAADRARILARSHAGGRRRSTGPAMASAETAVEDASEYVATIKSRNR